MNKLKIEHLAPYLPYGLKGISKEENLGIEIIKGYSTYGKNNSISLTTNIDDIDIEMFKPILRNLSDLTKEIEINGEKFIPKDKLFHSDKSWISFKQSITKRAIHCEPYWIIQKLFEWHFNVFGLIEKGLAIDINKINQ